MYPSEQCEIVGQGHIRKIVVYKKWQKIYDTSSKKSKYLKVIKAMSFLPKFILHFFRPHIWILSKATIFGLWTL